MRNYLRLFWLTFILQMIGATMACATNRDVLVRLDEALASCEKYDAVKQDQIKLLHQRASGARTADTRYRLCIALYDAYQSFMYDSASVYAEKAQRLALQLQNPDYLVEASCAKVFCLLSAGLYKEAFDEVGKVDISKATTPYIYKYYFVKWRLLADISDYSCAEPYSSGYLKRSHSLVDTLEHYMRPQSTEYNYIKGMQLMKEHKNNESEFHFLQVLKDKHISMHERAISTSCLGWLYKQMGENKKALDYLAEAAICDIKSSTKETTALREVGSLLYEQGKVDKAIVYVQKALDDANFYNARQRKIEIGNVLPIIQQSRYKDMKAQRNVMIMFIIMVCAFLVVLGVSVKLIKKQLGKLRQAQHTIEERNHKLELANAQLSEANKVKTEYIGKSFSLSAGYFDKLVKICRSIDHKLSARQYDDIRRMLSEKTLANERKDMFADFDETFLRLYPDFVEKYNALFEEKNRKYLPEKSPLTNEMRIFALIRLGINDSEHIASFLDYSVNTINTYKTRVKNKSIVSNEEFERRIMEI